MNEIKYRNILKEDIHKIAELHLESLNEGLLFDMGIEYTKLFYSKGLKSKLCFGYLAENEDEIIGAAIGTDNITKLYFKLLTSPKFILGLSKRVFKLKKLYPSAGKKPPTKEEFILFFVKPKHRNLYVALKLMKLIEEEYFKKGVRAYSLEVKENNETANKLYQYFGFKVVDRVGQKENKRLFYVKKIQDE